MNLLLNLLAWKRVQTPTLCRVGQPGKRDFFSVSLCPGGANSLSEFVIRPLGQSLLSCSRKVYVLKNKLCF